MKVHIPDKPYQFLREWYLNGSEPSLYALAQITFKIKTMVIILCQLHELHHS